MTGVVDPDKTLDAKDEAPRLWRTRAETSEVEDTVSRSFIASNQTQELGVILLNP